MSSPFKKKIVDQGFININFPLTRGTATALSSTTDTLKAAKNSLLALLSTRRGERMFSDFGTNLQSFVFDPNDDTLKRDIEREIKDSVSRWLPPLRIIDVKIQTADSRTMKLLVKFQLVENQYEDSLELII